MLKIILSQNENSSGVLLDPFTLCRSNPIQTNDYFDNVMYENVFLIKFCPDVLRDGEKKMKRTSMFFLHLKDLVLLVYYQLLGPRNH